MSSSPNVNSMLNKCVNEFKYCVLVLVLSVFVLFPSSQGILDVDNPKIVFELGQNLTQRLTNSPTGTKDDIINDLTDYYMFLNTAFRVENNSYPLGKEILQKLKARGGPPFLGVTIDDEYLEKNYEMGVVEVEHVKEVIDDVKNVWRDIKTGTIVPPEFENY